MFLAANSTIWPMASLLMLLTMVATSVTLMPTCARFSIACSFTSNRLPTPRCLFFSSPTPSNCKINAVLSGRLRGFAKLDVLGVANAVGRGENAIETDLLRVSDCVEKVRRQRRLAAREKNDDLAFWFERNGAIENRFRVFKRRLVNVADLVRIHEARIAHHVAAIGQVDRQHRAAAKLDIRCAVMMNVRIFGRAESRVRRRAIRFVRETPDRSPSRPTNSPCVGQVLRMTTWPFSSTICALISPGCSFIKISSGVVAGDDGGANFLDAARTKRIGLARENQAAARCARKISAAVPAPSWADGFAFGKTLIDGLKSLPGDIGKLRDNLRTGYPG